MTAAEYAAAVQTFIAARDKYAAIMDRQNATDDQKAAALKVFQPARRTFIEAHADRFVEIEREVQERANVYD